MPTNGLFPTPVYIESEFNHPSISLQKILVECDDIILKLSSSIGQPWDEKILSTFKLGAPNKLLDSTPLLKEYIVYHTDKYINETNELKEHPFKYNFYESWFNVSSENSYMHFHTHGSYDISGAFYVQTEGDGSDGAFTIRPDSTGLRSSKFIFYSKYDLSINPKIGSLILFPSYLQHAVLSNKSKKDRISISFNIGLY